MAAVKVSNGKGDIRRFEAEWRNLLCLNHENVIQVYLRNEYPTIADYNAKAGKIAEKYHFLVIADFPVNFTETAAKRLLSIVTSGARCGVFTLIHWDHRHNPPQDIIIDDQGDPDAGVSQIGDGFDIPGGPGVEILRPLIGDIEQEILRLKNSFI